MLTIAADYAIPVRLELTAAVGNLTFRWTEQDFIAAATSGGVAIDIPAEVLEHPDVLGFPIHLAGVLDTGFQRVAIPALYGSVVSAGSGRVFHRGEATAIPYVEAFFPRRDARYLRQGVPVDSEEDTGLQGGLR